MLHNNRVMARYAVAVAISLLMLGVTWILRIAVTDRIIFQPAFVAVMAVAFLCGMVPALVSVGLSALGVAALFLAPIGAATGQPSPDLAFVPVFLPVSAIGAAVAAIARRARQDANMALARLEALQASMPVGVAFVDNDGRYVSINQVMADINGFPAAAHVGRHFSEILPPPAAEMFVSIRDQITRTGEGLFNLPLMEPRSDPEHGDARHLQMSFFPVRVDGAVVGIGGTIFDMTAQRHAEAVIRQQAEQFRLLAETLTVMVWRMEPYGKATYLNAAALAYFGIEAMEHVADDWQMTVHPVDAEAVTAAWLQGMESRKPYVVEGRLQRACDGMYRWHLIHGSPLIDDKGTIVEWLGTSTDIHDQRQALAERETLIVQLRRAEAEQRQLADDFRSLADLVPHIIWTKSTPDTTDFINRRGLEYAGLPSAVRSTAESMQLVHPDDMATRLAWERALAEGAACTVEARMRRHDGVYRWQLIQTLPVRDHEGRIVRWIGCATDIDDQKRALAEREDLIVQLQKAEAEQRQTAEEFRLLAENLSVKVWRLSSDITTTFINAATREYFGLDADPNSRSSWLAKMHPDDLAAVDANRQRANSSRKPYAIEVRLQRASDGSYRWHQVHAAPVLDSAGHVQAWIGTSTDIEEHKQAIQLRETFLSVASHELKTPITALLLQLHVLKRRMGDADPALLQRIEVASRHGERLTKLVNNLLDVSRIMSGRFDDPQPLALREVVDEVVDRFALELETTRLEVIEDRPGPMVGYWDRLHVDQILTNLMTNALKYGQGSTITIRLGIDGDDACLAVSDGGPGIAEADLDRVFLQYHRLSSSDGTPGHGLGLWIVQHLTERMGGRVSVHSRPGEGATFSVRVPLAGGPSGVAEP